MICFPFDIHAFLIAFDLFISYLSKLRSLIFQWAEVLSFDAFSAFEEAGLDNDTLRL
jgi:hypothetical protein